MVRSRDETQSLWLARSNGCPLARERLILDHLPLCEMTLKRVCPTGAGAVDLEDLLSEAYIGLIRAVDRYDLNRGVKFSNYAIAFIRGAIAEHLRNEDLVPRGHRRWARQVAAAQLALIERGEDASSANVAAELQMDAESFYRRASEKRILTWVSLEELGIYRGGDKDPQSMAEMIPDPAPGPAALAEVADMAADLSDRVNSLRPRLARVLRRYFWDNLTMWKIGEEQGCSESRIKLLYNEAMNKLRGELGVPRVILWGDTPLAKDRHRIADRARRKRRKEKEA